MPPWMISAGILILNLTNYDLFLTAMNFTVGWILETFSWLLNAVSCVVVIIVVVVYFSPFGQVRFGGSKSRPILSYSNFIWIVLCTVMGAGLMLWACGEPMYHLYLPPANVAAGPLSGEAILWGMENILLSWTFTPMAIYSLPTILFAFAFYNMKKPFSISSMISPLLHDYQGGDEILVKASPAIDSVCLFCLCMGMAASLGAGILLVTSGLEKFSDGFLISSPALWTVCGAAIVAAFIISASSGIMRGIRLLSITNSYFYLVLGLFVFLIGPTTYLLNLCVESFGAYLSDFFKISLWTSTSSGDGWSRQWPTFYWCVWMAWMPVSVAFLGRIAQGFTVRETLNAVFLIPSIFSVVWLVIFSGTAIHQEMSGQGVYAAMQTGGTAAATYAVLDNLPFSAVTVPLFLITAFISYVTSADSNTNAIAGLCTKGLTAADAESPMILKVIWGLTIGAVCLIILIAYDIEGVKLLSYLGGLPVVFLMLMFVVCVIRVMRNPSKYDVYAGDYDDQGRPLVSVRPVHLGEESRRSKLMAASLAKKRNDYSG